MKKLFGFAVIIALITISSTLFAADELESLKTHVHKAAGGLKDLSCNLVVVNSNQRELQKMGKVFAELYEFKSAKVVFKAPDSLKINGVLGMMKVEFITAGNVRHIRIPSMRYKKREDISKEQEKRMSPLDVGVVSDVIWDIYNISLVRTEKNEDGSLAYVLKLKTAKSSKYQLIWIDGKDYKLLRRDRMFGDDSLKVKTLYFNHIKVNGIWTPCKAEVYNSEGKLAATTETKDITVNTGVEQKEFD
ncbi:MAG: outer membrane lipoprotein-sorting protein [Armatimonadota bacterium]